MFRANTAGAYVIKHLEEEPVPPHLLDGAPPVPAALEEVILCCLEKNPARRDQSISELRDELTRAIATEETVLKDSPMMVLADTRPAAGSRRRWPLVLLAGVVVAVLAVAAMVALQSF